MKFINTLAAAAIIASAISEVSVSVSAASEKDDNVVTDLKDLGYDENKKLGSYHLLYPASEHVGDECFEMIDNLEQNPLILRTALDGGALDLVFPGFKDVVLIPEDGNDNDIDSDDNVNKKCAAALVEVGTDISLAGYPMPHKRWSNYEDVHGQIIVDSSDSISDWWHKECVGKEICLMNYYDRIHPIGVYWIKPSDGSYIKNNSLEYGEQKTRCFNSFLGHQFIILDHEENPVPGGTFRVEHPLIIGFGESPLHSTSHIAPDHFDRRIESTLDAEWERHKVPNRTFSPLGFSKGRLPNDVFASMGSFYYNNVKNKYREEWNGKGVFVNWWETDVFMMQIPWNLKSVWAVRLAGLVSEWAGMPCVETVMYGLRQYESGARLLTHVDRLTTHVVSLIVNIAQGDLDEEWPVEVFDHAGRLHEVVMQPGDIVYYESAKNLHSRNRAMMGQKGVASYTNLFTHYRPKDMDEGWYLLPTPESHREPLLDDIDLEKTCTVPEVVKGVETEHLGYGKVRCEDPRLGKNLSPSLFVVKEAGDLIKWWRRTTPPRPGDNASESESDDASDATDPTTTSTTSAGTAYDRGDGVLVDDLGNVYGIDDDDDDEYEPAHTPDYYAADDDDDDWQNDDYYQDEQDEHARMDMGEL